MRQLYFLLFICLVTVTSKAQEETIGIDTINIDEVVVTGTKSVVNRNQVPLTISVVTSKTIEESGETSILPILSKQVPGLFVTERGVTGFGVATGAAGQISIRGLGGSPTTEVLVLLNGNPQYMGIFGHPLADSYRSSNIERVEVIRGPASTLYGSNAMSGVINIITKEQNRDGFSANASVQYGSYNTRKFSAGGGYKKGDFSVYTGINHDATDGHREASYFDITDGYVRADYKINDNFSTSIDFSLSSFAGADPGLDTGEVVVHGDTLDILRGMGAATLNNKFTNTDGSFRFFYNFGNHDISSGFLSDDYNYGIVVYQNFKYFKGNTITAGIDYKTYGGKADLTKFPGGWPLTDTSMTEIAGYVTAQQELFSKLTLNAGLRVDNHSIYGIETVPTGGFAYHPFGTTVFKGAISKGFRSPTIRELFIKFPGPTPNPNQNLLPESAINYEASIGQKLLDKKMNIEFTYFYIDAENLIKVGMDNNKLTFLNTGETVNNGIEVALNHRINKLIAWNSNYTYTHMQTEITGTPEHKLYIGTTLTPGKLRFNVNVEQISGLYTGNSSESYTLLNSRLSYNVHKTTSVFIMADNILDQEYQINYGYTMPGITIMAGVNFHY